MIVSDVPTIISDSVKIIVFATKITSATKKIFFVTEKIFSDTLPGSEIQRPADFAHREDLLREANDLLFGQKDLLRNEEDFLQARLDFLRLREDLLRNELLFLSSRRDHFLPEQIICAMPTHFSGMEKIFLVPDPSFLAANSMFCVGVTRAGR